MEAIAIQMMIDGWELKSWMFVAVGLFMLVFDVVSDLLGFPT